MEEKEEVLTSVEQLNEYLHNTADERSVISIVLEIAGTNAADPDTKGGDSNG